MSLLASVAPKTTAGRWAAAALAGILAVAALLTLFPYDEDDSRAPAALEPVRTDEVRGKDLRRITFTADRRFAAADTPFVAVSGAERGRASAHVVRGGRLTPLSSLDLPEGGTDAAVAVVRWRDSEPALGRVARRRGALRVSVASLDSGRRLFDRRIPVPEAVERPFATTIGPFEGARADIALLESAPARRRAADRATGKPPQGTLHVLQGETGFRGPPVTVGLPVTALSAGEWRPVLAQVEGSVPDLVLVRFGGVELPELHILSGESGLQKFIFQQRVVLSPEIAARSDWVPALEDGKPVVKAVDRADDRALVRVFSLSPG